VQWVKLLGVEDCTKIAAVLRRKGIVVLPGYISQAKRGPKLAPCPYIRISLSYASQSELSEGVRRMGSIIREHLV